MRLPNWYLDPETYWSDLLALIFLTYAIPVCIAVFLWRWVRERI